MSNDPTVDDPQDGGEGRADSVEGSGAVVEPNGDPTVEPSPEEPNGDPTVSATSQTELPEEVYEAADLPAESQGEEHWEGDPPEEVPGAQETGEVEALGDAEDAAEAVEPEEAEPPPPIVDEAPGPSVEEWVETAKAKISELSADLLEHAEEGNWRKVHVQLVAVALEAGNDNPDQTATRREADIAMALGNFHKVVDSLRKLSRGVGLDDEGREMLVAVYRAEEKWSPLIDLLKRHAKSATDKAEQVNTLHRMVAIYRDRLVNNVMEVQTYNQILKIDPVDLRSLEALTVKLQEMRRFPDLVKVLRKRAELVDEPEKKAELLLRVARVYVEISNQAEAIRAFEGVAEVDPGNAQAVGFLLPTYRKRGDWRKFVEIRKSSVHEIEDEEERADAIREIAHAALERLRNIELGESLFSSLLELVPGDAESLGALLKIYERQKNWEKLAEVLKESLEVLRDDTNKAPLLEKLAAIQAEKLDEEEAAIESYQALVAIDPENRRGREALKRLFVQQDRWDDLEAFYASVDGWAEYARLLESRAAAGRDSALNMDLLFRASRVWDEHLEEPNRATRSLEKVMAIEPGNRDAAEQLVGLYDKAENYRKLRDILGVLLEDEEEPEQRFEFLCRSARLSHQLRDVSTGYHQYTEAMSLLPARVDVLDEVESLVAAADRWRDLEAVYRQSLDGLLGKGGSEVSIAIESLTIRIARLLDERLGQPEAALEYLQGLLDEDNDYRPAVAALADVYRRKGEIDRLLEMLDRKLSLSGEVEDQARVLAELAEVHEELRQDIPAAIEQYKLLVERVDEGNAIRRQALAALHRLYEDAQSWAELADVLDAEVGELEETEVERRVEISRDLGRLSLHELSDKSRALAAYSDVLDVEPQDLTARADVQALLDDEDCALAAAEILTPIAEVEENWDAVAHFVETRLTYTKKTKKNLAERKRFLNRLIELHRDLRFDAMSAVAAARRLLALDPADEAARETLEALTELTGTWGELAEAYAERLEELLSGKKLKGAKKSLANQLAFRLGQIGDVKLQDSARAIAFYCQALEIKSDHRAALDALADLYTRTDAWVDLLETHQKQAAISKDEEEVKALRYRIAELYEHSLGDTERAIETLETILDGDAGERHALLTLDRLYEGLERFDDLARNIERQLKLQEPASLEWAEELCRLAELQANELGKPTESVLSYQQVLESIPGEGVALAGLEALLEIEEVAYDVSEFLVPIHQASGDLERYAKALRVQASRAGDPEERLSLGHQIASLYEDDLNQPSGAFDVLLGVLVESPLDENTTNELYRLAELTEEGLRRLCDRFHELASGLEGDAPITLLLRAATIAEAKIQDPTRAAGCRQGILDRRPGDEESIAALERLYLELQDWEPLVAVLMQKVELENLVADPDARKEVLFQASTIYYDMLNRRDESIATIERVVEMDPEDRRALSELDLLYRETEQWSELADNFERRLVIAEDDNESRDLWYALGPILEEQLEDHERAVETYRQILYKFENDRPALLALQRLCGIVEDWTSLLEILESLRGITEDRTESLQLLFLKGQLLQTRLMEVELAVDAYLEVIHENPYHGAALESAQEVALQGLEVQRIAEVLEPLHRDGGRWEKLIEVWGAQAEDALDPGQRAGFYRQIAEVAERELGDPVRAFEGLCGALREAPRDETLINRIERLGNELGRWHDIVALYSTLRDDLSEHRAQMFLGRRAATILEERLGDIEAAAAAFDSVLELDPTDLRSLQALELLYQRTQNWSQLTVVLDQEIIMCGSEEESIPLRFKLGVVLESQLNDDERAVDVFSDILAIEERNEHAIGALEGLLATNRQVVRIVPILEPIYSEREDWGRMLSLKVAAAGEADSEDQRFDYLYDAGEISLDRLEDSATAIRLFGRALAERPADEHLLERILGLVEQAAAWAEFANILEAALEGEPEEYDAARLSFRLAGTLEDHLGDFEGAVHWFRYTIDRDATNVEALRSLEENYMRLERWADLAVVLEKLREQAMNDEELVDLGFRLASLQEHQLGDIDKAIEAYQEVLDSSPTHVESYSALTSIYQSRANWDDLFNIYETQSSTTDSDEERVDIHHRMAELTTGVLDRPDDAIDLWLRVLDERPQDDTVLAALEGLYESQERAADLVEVLQKREQLTDDPAAQWAITEKLARTHRGLENLEQATDGYRRLLEIAPGDANSMLALRELYEATGDNESLVAIIVELVQGGHYQDEQVIEAYRKLAEVYGDELGQTEQAIDIWQQVLAAIPGDAQAVERLEQYFLDAGRWADAIGILEEKLQFLTETSEQGELLNRIADTWHNRIGDLPQALATYERLLMIDPTNADAYTVLDGTYREQKDWDRLAELYLGRLEHLTDPEERIDIWRAAADLFEYEKGEMGGAFYVTCSLFKEEPMETDTIERLHRLAEAGDKWTELVELYRDSVPQIAEKHGEESTLELHKRLADYCHHRLDRPEMAEIHYNKVLEYDSINEDAINGLEEILTNSGSAVELLAVLKRRMDLQLEVGEQIDLYMKVGLIHVEALENIDEAMHSFKMVMRLDSQNQDAMAALCRIYEVRGEWRELIELLDKRSHVVDDPEEVADVKFLIGQLWQNNMKIPERAADTYLDILATLPSYVPALDALQALYSELEKWDRYIDLLESRLDLEIPDDQRVRILLNMAQLYESEFKEWDKATDAYQRVLEVEQGNVEVIRALQTIFTRNEEWDDLSDLLGQQVQFIDDVDTRIELWSLDGTICAERLGDVGRAIDCFNLIIEVDDAHKDALERLADLYEQAGQWEDCIGAYEKLMLLSPDVEIQTALLCRVGRIYEENILDDQAAMERYQTALDMNPGCKAALTALRLIAEKREDWPYAVAMLEKEVEYSRDLGEKSRLLADIGELYEASLEDFEGAMGFYERAIDLDPGNAIAASPLAERFLAEENWARAIPLLETLIANHVPEGDGKELYLLHFNLAAANEELGMDEEALEEYGKSHELEERHLPTLEGLSRLYEARDEHERAFVILQQISEEYAGDLEPDKLARLYVRQGEIKQAAGERRAAQDLYGRALDSSPSDTIALSKMIDVLKQAEDWEQMVEYQTRLAYASTDLTEQLKLLVDNGDVYSEKLGQVEAATEAYKAALVIEPSSKVVLERLLKVFTSTEQWKRASEILGKLAEIETEPERHAKFCLAVAYILRDHLDDIDRAVDFFERTLDAHMGFLEAFQAIDAIYTEAKRWKDLERSYRKMIKRVTESQDGDNKQLKLMLWRNLGEIYRTRLQQFDEAIAAFKIATRLAPTDRTVNEILADLYERVGGHQEDAIEQHHRLIQVSPLRVESYQALFTRYLEIRDFDSAWCVASALYLLQKAGEDEKKYYKKYLGTKMPVARKPLNNEHWSSLYHPDQHLVLGSILSIYANYLRHAFSCDVRTAWKVHKKKDALDLSKQVHFTKLFNYAVRVLGVPPAVVYLKQDHTGGIRNANADPPALVVGADMVRGRDERELAFTIGKAIALMRPEHYLGGAFPSTENLKLFFFAALKVSVPGASIPIESEDLDRLVKEIKRMPHVLAGLQKSTKQFIELGENPDFSNWRKAIEHTSDRLGLLLCGDLVQAVQAINGEQTSISKASSKKRIRELVLFSVSRNYLALRKELGLALGS
jgi:tetratricopeptide (TPR) repeat protein